MRQTHEVAITGIGMVTPLGTSTQTTWKNVCAGVSGAIRIPPYATDAAEMVVALVHGEQQQLDAILDAKEQERSDRFMHLALLAAAQALADAKLDPLHDVVLQADTGVYLGVGVGGLERYGQAGITIAQQGARRISPVALPRAISNMAAAWVAMRWGLKGPMLTIANACASGSDAVGMGFRLVRDGVVPRMLVGGAEACVGPLALAGFHNMRALSRWQGDPALASRPFDVNRDGFVMAEGGAVLVLERLDDALARGAHVYATVSGYGSAADAYHITAMQPDGAGLVTAMRMALAEGQVAAEKIGYINAHGTSTPMNDVIETRAIKQVCGMRVPVSSTKSMTGHMLGATGAAEAAFCALALQEQLLPPTINLRQPDPACDLDYIPAVARVVQGVDYALSLSCAFGGANAALLLKRFAP